MSRINFQQQVIERSFEVPVVVDFWAPWCGPCRMLGPTIEQLAAEANGRWELVKVNTEEEQQIAMQFRIQSIPAVKMFVKGQVVGEFMGALSRHQILAWLDEHIPNPDQAALEEIIAGWEMADAAQLTSALSAFLSAHPGIAEAPYWLALSLLRSNTDEARAIVANAPTDPKLLEFQEDILTLAELLETPATGTEGFVHAFSKAQEAFRTAHYEASLEHLIEAVMLDKSFSNELPRRATVALFRRFGQQHPISKKYQRRFSMALY